MYDVVDYRTKEKVSPKGFVFTGVNRPWEVMMDLEAVRRQIHPDSFRNIKPCLAKYLPLLPLRDYTHFVSLGETATPLVKSKVLGEELGLDLYFKMESKNPTGSFKDRGSSVELSVAKELDASGIVLASTGNMAASCACYAAAARLPCYIAVPEGVPMAKLAQALAFGATVVQVAGSYNDAACLAEAVAERMGFFLAGDYAFRVEGQKTAAFELMDQLPLGDSDLIVIPMGCGTNIAAYAKGFSEYRELGLAQGFPRLTGVQAVGAAAVVNAYEHRRTYIQPLEKIDTIASAIAVGAPIDGEKALNAIYSSGGEALAVTDDEILEAQHRLCSDEGFFVESAAAATVAGVLKAAREQRLDARTVVCVLTGEGLKDPYAVLKKRMPPPLIEAHTEAFEELLKKRQHG